MPALVDVVDMLPRLKFSPEMLGHHISVLRHDPTVLKSDSDVFRFWVDVSHHNWDTERRLHPAETTMGTQGFEPQLSAFQTDVPTTYTTFPSIASG